MLKKILFYVFIIAIVIFCFFPGKMIPISIQIKIIESVRNTASIIFGVIGVWIAILNTDFLLIVYALKENNNLRNYDNLISPIRYATFTIVYSLLFKVLSPVIYTIPFCINHKNVIRGIS